MSYRLRKTLKSGLCRGTALLLFCAALDLVAFDVATPAAASEDAKTLRSVALVFRHGVISPKYTPPKVKAEWPMGFKQLTAVGMQQLYAEGQALRAKYVDDLKLVSDRYHVSEVFVRASNTDRALQSAQILSLGLFPLGTGPDPSEYDSKLEAAPSKALAFTPVPVHSVALTEDSLLRPWTGQANCSRYRAFVKTLETTDNYRDKAAAHTDFLIRMAAVTGVNEGAAPARILYLVNEIYEPLSALVQHGKPLPPEISKDDMQLLSDLSDWNYHHQFLGKGVGQVTGGVFAGELVRNFQDVASEGPRRRKLYLYSAHQRTLLGIEAAFGIETLRTKGPHFRGRIASLGSHYAFELHEPSVGEFAVRASFTSSAGKIPIEVPGCGGEMCPLSRFAEVLSEVVPKDWRQACGG